MKYPIGIQSFESLRTDGYVYVDKTDLVYQLTEEYKYVFLGRPRRFGKSLLMSTVQAYFEGRKDLFEGLAIEYLATDWAAHPVLHFDLNIGDYTSVDGLREILDIQLARYERLYGRCPDSYSLQYRLQWLIQQAHEQTGQRAVILIDEYDKPVLHAIGDDKRDEAFRNILKPFYGTLKTEDAHIRFAMLTGVTKFGKLSVFSDLNNIKDISLLDEYSTICGITKDEILRTFKVSLSTFAAKLGVDENELIEMLRVKYDGYSFAANAIKVFNPYSLLNAFADKQLRDYWFESGTPTFLVKLLKRNNYDLTKIDGVKVSEDSLYQVDNITAIPILYQSGYLTIKDYISEAGLYKLGYPNREVANGFMSFLLPFYSKVPSIDTRSELYNLTSEIKAGDVDAFMIRLKSLLVSVPYAQDNIAKVQEGQVRNLTYLIFKLLGFQIQAECHMNNGRSDAVVWTTDHIYVFEFKVDSTAEAAIKQIHDKGYAAPYAADPRSVTLIGVNYSTSDRLINQWIAEEYIK